MELKLKRIPIEEPEVLEIRCHKVTDDVQEIVGILNGTTNYILTKMSRKTRIN